MDKFQCHIVFPSQDIKQNVEIRVEDGNTKILISREQKELFR